MYFKSREERLDFLSFYKMKKLEGRKATKYQLYIDFMRKNTKHALPLLDIAAATEDDTIYNIWVSECLEKLDKTDRIIFVLRFAWGFNLDEIAYCFNHTESAIHQRLTNIEKKIRRLN